MTEEEHMTACRRIESTFGSDEIFDKDFRNMLTNLGIVPGEDGVYNVDYRQVKAIMMCGSSSGIYTMTEAFLNALGSNLTMETKEAIRGLADTLSDALWDMTVRTLSGEIE